MLWIGLLVWFESEWWSGLARNTQKIPAGLTLQAAHVPDLFLLKAGRIDQTRALIVELGYHSSMWIQLDRTIPEIAAAVGGPVEDLCKRLEGVLPLLAVRVRELQAAYRERRFTHEVADRFWEEIMNAL